MKRNGALTFSIAVAAYVVLRLVAVGAQSSGHVELRVLSDRNQPTSTIKSDGGKSALSSQDSTQPDRTKQSQGSEHGLGQEDSGKVGVVKWWGPETAPNWVLAAIALVGAIVAFLTLRSARLAVLLTERADVLIAGIGVSTDRALAPETVVTLQFKNYGRTRASRLKLNGWLGEANAPPGGAPPYDIPAISLGAGDTFPAAFGLLSSSITRESFDAIAQGTALLRFEGTISYEDVFGESHISSFAGTWRTREKCFTVDRSETD